MATISRRDFLAAGAAAAALTPRGAVAQAPTIDAFFASFTDEWVRNDPSLATAARYFSGDEQDRLERQLTPQTRAWKLDRIRLAQKGLAELRKFDRASLSGTRRISADLMEWLLNQTVAEEPFLDYRFPLEQMGGVNVNLVEQMTVRRPLLNERDAENYVAAMGQVRSRMEEAIAEARSLETKRIIPPRFILQATVKQIRGFTSPAPGQNPFVTVLAEKMTTAGNIPEARREQLRASAERIVAEQIYPTWARAASLLESQQEKATDAAGLWRLNGGPDAYVFALRHFTTTNLKAAEIHQIGLDRVAHIESEMDGLLKRLGRTEGSVKERSEKLKLDLRYRDPASEASRDQIMRDIDGILSDAQARAALLFDVRPKAAVVARPFPRFREANAAANYNAPPPDGSRPGVFQYPRRLDNMTRFGLKSIVYHETVPGHHFQIALQVENKELPRFRQIGAFGGISALTEGWGLYAERLAAESGWYGDDTEGRLGQLYYELFRARRLVVDTGIHAMKWTRQQGIDYGIEASEVERYTVFPGQACSYMIGELKIVELREKARKEMADRFSLRQFHDVVLRTGTVPLSVLEQQVNAWITGPAPSAK